MVLTIEAIAIDIRNEFRQKKKLFEFSKENIGSGSLLLCTSESKCIFVLISVLRIHSCLNDYIQWLYTFTLHINMYKAPLFFYLFAASEIKQKHKTNANKMFFGWNGTRKSEMNLIKF